MANWLEQQNKQAADPFAPASGSWLQSFGESTVGSLGEFFGFEKSPDVQRWEAQHPWSALGSNLAGYAIPFGTWEKTLVKLPKVQKIIAGIGNAEKAPVLTKGLQEIAKFAPLEAGRIGVAAGFGDRPIGEVAGEALFDLGAIGTLTAGVEGLTRYGKKRTKLSDLVPGADPALPSQLQMRAAKEFLGKESLGEVTPETAELVRNRISEFEKIVRLEEVTPGYRYVGPLEKGTQGKDVSRLFEVDKETSGISRKLFMSGPKGFFAKTKDGKLFQTAQEQLDEVWSSTGWGDFREKLPYMQFPRVVTAKKKNGAGFITGAVQREMDNVADGLWLSRERNNGLFVVAKKVKGEGGKAGVGDQWVLFKTDTPGKFAPVEEHWAQSVADKAAWLAEPEKVFKATGAKIYDFAEGVARQFPMMNFIGAVEPTTKLAQQGMQLAKKMGLEKVEGAGQAFGDFFNRYFVPSAYQFSKSPRANWINSMARATYDEAERLSRVTMYGEHALKDKNLWKASIAGASPKGGVSIKSLLEPLGDEDVFQVWKAWNSRMSKEDVAAAFGEGKISQPAKAFLDHLQDLDQDLISQIQTTQAAFGQELFKPMKDHYMISRTWAGDHRVPIHNELGELVYMAAGKDKKGAEQLAQEIINEAGNGWTKGEAFLSNRSIESPIELGRYFSAMDSNKPGYFQAAKIVEKIYETRQPAFMQTRMGVKGYQAEKLPWTKDDLEKILKTHLDQQHRYMAKLTVNERFGADRAKLLAEDPAMFETLEDRLMDLEGKQGPLAEIQNKLADRLLAPVLGANSASKIAKVTNNVFMHLNLGALTLGQPIVNALTFMHTVIPEAAFVLNGLPERLAPYYGISPIAGEGGLVKGAVNFLDPLRLMKQSFKEMGKPSQELYKMFERAAGEGIVAPRMVEEYIGEGAAKIGDLRKAISSPGGFAEWTVKVSESLMAGTEKLSRGNAFVVGNILGRDFLKLEGEQLYQFSKRFTQRTMYGYATADRSRIFTTPVGSMFGLFKNWMSHFIGGMLLYTDEALLYNNWSPLLWQTAGLGAVGGIAATGPMYMLADGFSKMATDKPLMDNMYEHFGQGTSDALFFGLPASLGFSLSASSAAPFANPARDITQLFSFVHLDRMNAISKAMGTAVDQWDAGQSPLKSELVRLQLARAFLPKTLYRTIAAWEDKGIRSLSTGNVNISGLTPVERLAYASGLNPVKVEREYRVADALWKDQDAMKEKVQSYGLAFYEARERKDSYTMREIMLKAMAEGLDFSRVLRSVNARDNKEIGNTLERKFAPQELWKKRFILSE